MSLPKGHVVLVISASQSGKNIFPQGPVICIGIQGLISFVQGAVSILEPPQVDELILLPDKNVEVPDAKAAKVKPGLAVLVKELAELLVCFGILVDAVGLYVVRLNFHDLLLG